VDVHDGAVDVEHVVDRSGDSVPIHPVEGLGEDSRAKLTEAGWEVLGSQIAPGRVVHHRHFGQAGGLSDHVGVGVYADDLGIVRSQHQADRTGSASDVEQPPRSIEGEPCDHLLNQSRRVGDSAGGVEARAASEKGRVPIRCSVVGHLNNLGESAL
jgi:hypothetical protein